LNFLRSSIRGVSVHEKNFLMAPNLEPLNGRLDVPRSLRRDQDRVKYSETDHGHASAQRVVGQAEPVWPAASQKSIQHR
jgi:hypothetical protein